MKALHILMLLGIGMTLCACGKKKYIQAIPYKFQFDEAKIKKHLAVDKIEEPDSTLDEYEHKLTTREIYLKEKYAIILNLRPHEIKNYRFYDFIDRNLNKQYIYQSDVVGTNMALFVKDLYTYTYDIQLPTNPISIFNSPHVKLFMGRNFLSEGDLIFFRYSKDNPVSDMGVYLRNNKIVAVTADGKLAIYDFSDSYFQKRYLVSGRLQVNQ